MTSTSAPCPYHAVLDQRALLRELFGLRADLSELPFFPTAGGGFTEKRHVVHSIEYVAGLVGEPLVDSQGVRRFGGHSLRVTGARSLAGMGIDLMLIQLMARWSSNVVLRYVSEAPLQRMSDTYRCKSAAQVLGTSIGELRSQLLALQASAAADARTVQYLHDEVALLSAAGGKAGPSVAPYIRNLGSGVVHRPLVWSLDIQSVHWRAYCGWAFGSGLMEPAHSLPDDATLICGCCFKPEKQAALAPVRDSDSESSAASSHSA